MARLRRLRVLWRLTCAPPELSNGLATRSALLRNGRFLCRRAPSLTGILPRDRTLRLRLMATCQRSGSILRRRGERAGCKRDRCDHSIKVKKPFHRQLLKLVHPDCWLSERRFDFHSMRVSGEKTALVQIVTSAP